MKKEKDSQAEKKTPSKEDEPIIHELEPMKETKVTVNVPVLIIFLAVILSGIFTGYVLAKGGASGAGKQINSSAKTAEGLKKVIGVQDEKTFKDSAEGILREGGAKGEGTHHLERAGGPSQDVYLTSSTISFDEYVGKKVKVWGETFSAKTAGWLMDVGRLELLE
jgi:hypothetical protein